MRFLKFTYNSSFSQLKEPQIKQIKRIKLIFCVIISLCYYTDFMQHASLVLTARARRGTRKLRSLSPEICVIETLNFWSSEGHKSLLLNGRVVTKVSKAKH